MPVTRRKWKNKDGKESVTWSYSFYDSTGKQHKKSGFSKRSDAEEALRKAEIAKPIPSKIQKLLFNDVAEKYIKEHCSLYCKPATIKVYESHLNSLIYPYFFNKRILDIKPSDINAFISEIKKPKMIKKTEKIKTETGKTIKLIKEVEHIASNKTVNNYITLLTSMFNYAVNLEIIEKNPAAKIKKLQLPHKEMEFLATEEIFILLDNAKEHYPDFYPVVFTAVFTGMRKGELLALTWDKIDFKNNTITINKSLFGGKLQDPKTKTSIRKIDMVDELASALKEYKRNTNKLTKFVFHNANGNYLDPDNMVKRKFNPLLNKAGIKRIRWHDLRHTYASLLISQNLPIKYIQRQMGHSSIQVTLDRYGHLMPDIHNQAISALNRLFDKDNPLAINSI